VDPDVGGIAEPDGHLGNDGDRDDARSLEERGRALADAYRELWQRLAELEAKYIGLNQSVDELTAESPQLDSDIAEIHAGYMEIGKELDELEALLVQLKQEKAKLAAAETAGDRGTPQQPEDEPSPKRVTTGILSLVAGASSIINATARYIPYSPARLVAFIVCRAAICVVLVVLFRRWNAARRTKDRSDNRAADPG
jgi:hypothetical protein